MEVLDKFNKHIISSICCPFRFRLLLSGTLSTEAMVRQRVPAFFGNISCQLKSSLPNDS